VLKDIVQQPMIEEERELNEIQKIFAVPSNLSTRFNLQIITSNGIRLYLCLQERELTEFD
jgi:hypothetical protein